MGMLDYFKQAAVATLEATQNPRFGEGLAYIQARRAGIPAYEILPQLQQARSARERDEIMKRQVAVDERDQQMREDVMKRKQSMVEAQSQAARSLSQMSPEQQAAYLKDPANMAWWFGPDADTETSKAILGTITPQQDEWVNVSTRIGPDNIKYAVQQNKTDGSIREVEIGAQRAPATTTVNVADKSYDTAIAKQQAKWEESMANSAGAAAQRREQMARLKPLINQIETGRLAPALATIGAVLQSVGLDPASFGVDPNLAPTAEVIRSITNKMAISNRDTSQGGGMPGAMSDADRIFLMQTVPSMQNTPAGNNMIIQIEEATANREIERYQAWLEYAGKAVEAGATPNRHSFEMLWMQKARNTPLFPVITDQKVIDSLPPGTIYSNARGEPTVKNAGPVVRERDPELGTPWKKHQRKP